MGQCVTTAKQPLVDISSTSVGSARSTTVPDRLPAMDLPGPTPADSAAPPVSTCEVVPRVALDPPSEHIPPVDQRAKLIAACLRTPAWEDADPFPEPAGMPLDTAPPRAVSDLRAVISGVSLALTEIKAYAAAAIEQAAAMRDNAFSASDCDVLCITASYEALVADILHAEASKTAALEAELVAADALLERTENEIREIVYLSSSATDDSIITLEPGLSARLAEVVAVLRASPRGPQGDPTLILVNAAHGESPYGDAFGFLRTSCIVAAELSLLCPRTRRIQPGGVASILILFKEDVGTAAFGGSQAEAAATLAKHLVVQAWLAAGPDVPRRLVVHTVARLLGPDIGISVSICCPRDVPPDSHIVVESMRTYGEALSCWAFPLVLRVGPCTGISSPGLIPEYGADYQTLCVTDDARVYVPAGSGACVFDHELRPLGKVHCGNKPFQAAAYDDGSDVLFLSGNESIVALERPSAASRVAGTPLVGIPYQPAATNALCRGDLTGASTFEAHSIVRWRHDTGIGLFEGADGTDRLGGGGIALLPELGFVVLARYYANELAVFRLSDGTLVSSVGLPRPIYITAGWPAEVYASSEKTGTVYAVKIDSAGRASPPRVIFSHPAFEMSSPLAAVPPGPGRSTWHLAIAMYDGTRIAVLELPGCTPVFEGDVGYVCRAIRGLAADPSGGALLVSDTTVLSVRALTGVVRSLCWPLEGMPELI